jgi:hypothetical protein
MLRSRPESSRLGRDEADGADTDERRQEKRQTTKKTRNIGNIRTLLPLFVLTVLGLVIALAVSLFDKPSLDPSSLTTTRSSSSLSEQDPVRNRNARTRLQEEEEDASGRTLETDSSSGSDGTFNGFPVTYRPGSPTSMDSSVHCVGENYGVDAWMYRSCQFRHLCYDLDLQELVLFPSAEEKRLLDLLSQRQRDNNNNREVTIQSIMSPETKVALGPIQNLDGNATSRNDQRHRLEWFPTAAMDHGSGGYYELPSNVVLVPFFSTTPFGTRRWIWQDLLSIFTLLSIFGLQDKQLALMDYNPQQQPCSLSSQDETSSSRSDVCHQLLSQVLAAMGVRSDQYRPKHLSALQLAPGKETRTRESNLVCARAGAAGIGMIANQSPKPAQIVDELKWTHTMTGRGATLREFRNYMARHLKMSIPSAVAGSGSTSTSSTATVAPVRVTFFEQGPKEGVLDDSQPRRELESLDFKESYRQVRSAVSEQEVSVEWFHTSTLDFAFQASKAAESAIFITFCGEQAVAATFLPKGASLIVYCDGGDGGESDRKTSWSKRLDWRVLNNAAYFRTHWLPLQSVRTTEGLAALVRLVASELDLVRQQV